jgi:hypothetical protein
MQNLINNFVKGTLRIAKGNITSSLEKGGLSMIDLNEFLVGLQSNWVKRTFNSTIDGWRTDINERCRGNVLITCPQLLDKNEHPTLFNIGTSFYEFKKRFYELNDNFMQSYVIGNPLLVVSRQEKAIFDTSVFNFNNNIVGLKICNFFNFDGSVKNANLISDITDTVLLDDDYGKFRSALLDSRYLAEKNSVKTDAPGLGLDEFITRFKKGSRPFRKVLGRGLDAKIKCKNKSNIKTFFRLIGIDVIDENELKKLNKQWGYNLLQNKTREFAFKFLNNILGLNTRVSHFNRTVSRECTFCVLKNVNNAPDECFLHLFFECNSVGPILDKFCNDYLGELNLNTPVKKRNSFFWV